MLSLLIKLFQNMVKLGDQLICKRVVATLAGISDLGHDLRHPFGEGLDRGRWSSLGESKQRLLSLNHQLDCPIPVLNRVRLSENVEGLHSNSHLLRLNRSLHLLNA